MDAMLFVVEGREEGGGRRGEGGRREEGREEGRGIKVLVRYVFQVVMALL